MKDESINIEKYINYLNEVEGLGLTDKEKIELKEYAERWSDRLTVRDFYVIALHWHRWNKDWEPEKYIKNLEGRDVRSI